MTVLYPNSSYNDVCYKAGPFHCNIGVSWPGPYVSHCQNSSKFLSVSYLMKTADVIMIFFLHTILLIILSKAS